MNGSLKLIAYCDASLGNLSNGGSQGGMIIYLSDVEGKLSPISWSSKKLERVARSTIAAETMALVDSADTCTWLTHMLNEILDNNVQISELFTDNKSLKDAAYSTTAVEEKRLRVDIAAIREAIQKKEIHVKWVSNTEQVADVFTKQGANNKLLIKSLRYGYL